MISMKIISLHYIFNNIDADSSVVVLIKTSE